MVRVLQDVKKILWQKDKNNLLDFKTNLPWGLYDLKAYPLIRAVNQATISRGCLSIFVQIRVAPFYIRKAARAARKSWSV